MQISMVLVNPQRAENVGAAARAMQTMGFRDLRLVGAPLHQAKPARILAHGSGDLLDQARNFASLAEALDDIDLVVGTTAKARHQRRYHYDPLALARSLHQQQRSVSRCAIVFGCEPQGLNNDEIAHCDLLSQIPMAAPQPSLNLAQAVMIYCFALSSLATAPTANSQPSPTGLSPASETAGTRSQYKALKKRLSALLTTAGIEHHEKSHRWALERLAQGHDEDIRFLHFICHKLESRLPGPGQL